MTWSFLTSESFWYDSSSLIISLLFGMFHSAYFLLQTLNQSFLHEVLIPFSRILYFEIKIWALGLLTAYWLVIILRPILVTEAKKYLRKIEKESHHMTWYCLKLKIWNHRFISTLVFVSFLWARYLATLILLKITHLLLSHNTQQS